MLVYPLLKMRGEKTAGTYWCCSRSVFAQWHTSGVHWRLNTVASVFKWGICSITNLRYSWKQSTPPWQKFGGAPRDSWIVVRPWQHQSGRSISPLQTQEGHWGCAGARKGVYYVMPAPHLLRSKCLYHIHSIWVVRHYILVLWCCCVVLT